VVTKQARVLVIGSHPVIRGVVRLACASIEGVELVAEVDSAAAAPGRVAATEPDLVVLDLDAESGHDLELLRALRTAGFSGDVVVLSDHGDGAGVLEAMRLGARGYLTKAEGLRRVGDAIRGVLAGEHVLDPALEQAAVMELGRFARQAREGSEVDATLTHREREILALLSEGLTMQQIGRRLTISPRTVETHVAKLYRKLSVRTRVQAVARAASLGLIELR
jgi:two-component system, NarL family, response regulator DevR